MKNPIPVIYILGSGHSGSTLLDLIIGSHSQIESGGEIYKYFDYISDSANRPQEKRICACRQHVNDCPYWSKIKKKIKSIYGTWEISLQPNDFIDFENHNYDIMRTMLSVSQKRIFCDSSKNYSRLRNLLKSDLFNVNIIHLVRDGRGVAYSHYRKKNTGFYNTLIMWQQFNIANLFRFKALKIGLNYFFLRYEDLVNCPCDSITNILKKIGLDFENKQLQFWEFEHHNISGNRMRKKEKQEIKRDELYKTKINKKQWIFGTMLSALGLKLFGYHFTKAD